MSRLLVRKRHVLAATQSGGSSVFNLVNSIQYGSGGATGGTTPPIDTTGATLIVIGIAWYAGPVTVTDSKGNTFTVLPAHQSADGIYTFFYAINPVVGTNHTFTTNGTTVYPAAVIYAFKGPTNPVFQVEIGKAVGGSPLQTGSVTPSKNGALIISGIGANIATNPVINLGFTQVSIPTNSGICVTNGTGYLIQSTAAPINPTWTWAGTASVGLSIIVILPS